MTCKQTGKVKLLLEEDHEYTTEGRLLVRKLDLTDLHSVRLASRPDSRASKTSTCGSTCRLSNSSALPFG